MNNEKFEIIRNGQTFTIDPRKYSDYYALSKSNSEYYLMISELIDNSIGSVEKQNQGKKISDWKQPLIITIEFNTIDQSQSSKNAIKYRVSPRVV